LATLPPARFCEAQRSPIFGAKRSEVPFSGRSGVLLQDEAPFRGGIPLGRSAVPLGRSAAKSHFRGAAESCFRMKPRFGAESPWDGAESPWDATTVLYICIKHLYEAESCFRMKPRFGAESPWDGAESPWDATTVLYICIKHLYEAESCFRMKPRFGAESPWDGVPEGGPAFRKASHLNTPKH
jgi:hypothetical protein